MPKNLGQSAQWLFGSLDRLESLRFDLLVVLVMYWVVIAVLEMLDDRVLRGNPNNGTMCPEIWDKVPSGCLGHLIESNQ